MSKRPRKAMLFVRILIGVLILIGLLVAIAAIHQNQTKERINNKYHTLQLPGHLILQSATWEAGNIDNSAAWTYKYAATGQRSEIFSALEGDLKNSGYSIDFANDQNKSYITARNTNDKMYLFIYLLPNNDVGPPQPLNSVSILAEELPK